MSFLKKRYLSFSALCAISAMAAFCLPLTTHADEAGKCKDTKHTHLSFHSEGEISMQPNLLILHLRAEHSAANPAKAQAELNQMVAHALSNANQGQKNIAGLEIQTGDYSVNQTGSDSKSSAWSASQEISIKAPVDDTKPAQSEALLRIGGNLQNLGLSLNQIEWTLDENTKKSVTDKAIQKALEALIPEAKNAGKALGLNFISLESVNIDRPYFQGPTPRVMLMSAASNRMAKDVAPQSNPHELHISASANAVAVLGK
ncbi:DUF541 domain-containing protein [Acetobacteraceae bacterium]|nr:DUF541 domain-containing protein [Acetobacteraceae bacterium]